MLSAAAADGCLKLAYLIVKKREPYLLLRDSASGCSR